MGNIIVHLKPTYHCIDVSEFLHDSTNSQRRLEYIAMIGAYINQFKSLVSTFKAQERRENQMLIGLLFKKKHVVARCHPLLGIELVIICFPCTVGFTTIFHSD